MDDPRAIAFDILLDGRRADSETTCVWAGPYALAIVTVLPEPGLAVEVHSIFVGHPGVATHATHLRLGPVGREPAILTAEHEHASLDPTIKARECAYEHAGFVLKTLKNLGCDVGIDVSDDAFRELERVER